MRGVRVKGVRRGWVKGEREGLGREFFSPSSFTHPQPPATPATPNKQRGEEDREACLSAINRSAWKGSLPASPAHHPGTPSRVTRPGHKAMPCKASHSGRQGKVQVPEKWCKNAYSGVCGDRGERGRVYTQMQEEIHNEQTEIEREVGRGGRFTATQCTPLFHTTTHLCPILLKSHRKQRTKRNPPPSRKSIELLKTHPVLQSHPLSQSQTKVLHRRVVQSSMCIGAVE